MTDATLMSMGGGEPSSSLIKEATTQSFVSDVIEESQKQPVLVDFWAPWCGPCKQLTPIIEKAVNAAKGRVKLVKMNIDDHPEIPGQMGVQSIPAVIAFKDGRPLDGFMGAVPESQIKDFIDKIAGPAGPSDVDLYIEQGEKLLTEEQFEAAAQHFGTALQMASQNLRAIVGLANAAIGLGDYEQAQQIIAMAPPDKENDPMVKAVHAQLDLLSKAADSGEIASLTSKVDANPDDHEARVELALALNAAGRRQDAAGHLLEIVARDRSWQEDRGRKELLTFFEAWGPMDEATVVARKKLSSLLFS